MSLRTIGSFLLYIGVNLTSVSLDYACFLGLTHVFGLPILQSVIAYAVAQSVNYYLSRRFVFKAAIAGKSEQRLMSEFLATSLLGLAITAAVTGTAIHALAMSPFEAKTAAVLTCFVVLYIVRSQLVFRAVEKA